MPFLLEEEKPTSTKIIRNVGSGVLRLLFVAPVPFLLTPLILHKIGTRGYGTWAVILAISNLTSLADLGLLGTLSKYVAEYHAKRDFAALGRLFGTGLTVFGMIGALVVLLLWLVSPFAISSLFGASGAAPDELLALFHRLLLLVALNILTFPFSSVTSGLQRLDITNFLTSINLSCGAALGATFLLMGQGVRGLLYGSIISAALTLAIYVWFVRRLLPQVPLTGLHANLREAKKIFAFSMQIYVTQGAVAIHNQIEKLFLAKFVGVVAAGWYDIASEIAVKTRSVPGLLLGPILPAASELDARGGQRKLVELYYRTHKYLAFVGVPLVFYGVAVSKRFVELWIGPSLSVVAAPLGILLVVNFFNLMTGPGFMILAGQGYLRPGVYSALLGVGLNVPLSFALIYYYGFAGAVTGTSVSLVTASAFFLYLFHRHTQNSIGRLFREAYMKPILCAIVLSACGVLLSPVGGLSWAGLVVQGSIFCVLYAALLLFAKFFDRYDWDKAESVTPIARLARRFFSLA
jgi:O-antigen/teichoic acid export membrane protein